MPKQIPFFRAYVAARILSRFKDVTNQCNSNMQPLNFPTYPMRLRSQNAVDEVFDPVRKRWVVNTPEEWVRQHLIAFLHHERGVPLTLMGVEKKLIVHGMTRRTDIVVYGKNGQPKMICECKAPDIKINQGVMDQAAHYNITLKVPYLLITNGKTHHCAKIDHQAAAFEFLPDIPSFFDMNENL
jgi:Type I restriction enzyme R protein N terminus (HSDR_N)